MDTGQSESVAAADEIGVVCLSPEDYMVEAAPPYRCTAEAARHAAEVARLRRLQQQRHEQLGQLASTKGPSPQHEHDPVDSKPRAESSLTTLPDALEHAHAHVEPATQPLQPSPQPVQPLAPHPLPPRPPPQSAIDTAAARTIAVAHLLGARLLAELTEAAEARPHTCPCNTASLPLRYTGNLLGYMAFLTGVHCKNHGV
jgi:hypothetical protein